MRYFLVCPSIGMINYPLKFSMSYNQSFFHFRSKGLTKKSTVPFYEDVLRDFVGTYDI